MGQTDTATERFINAQNVILFRKRLTETTEPARRLQLLRLLGEQEAKKQLPPQEKRLPQLAASHQPTMEEVTSAGSLCVVARPEAHSATNCGLPDVHYIQ